MFDCYNAAPHPEQNRAPCGLGRWQCGQAVSGFTEAKLWTGAALADGMFTVMLTGWLHPGTAIPRDAAIPAAWMALNSRTRLGMKKHSIKPRNVGMLVQQKTQ